MVKGDGNAEEDGDDEDNGDGYCQEDEINERSYRMKQPCQLKWYLYEN